MSVEDHRALVALMQDLELTGISADNAPRQEFSFYTMALLLTEATVGYEMNESRESVPTPTDDLAASTASPTTSFASWSDRASSEKSTERCEDTEVLVGLTLVAQSCQQTDNDDSGSSYPGVAFLTCETKNRAASYDLTNRCFRKYETYSGPRQQRCVGRCGAGCGTRGGLGPYTQDCLDHDKCVADHGYLAPGCQDEFRQVYRDARSRNNCDPNR